jgi:hypothetical protein
MSEASKTRTKLLRAVGNAIEDFGMIEDDFKKLKATSGDIEAELDLAVGHTHEDLQPTLVSIM